MLRHPREPCGPKEFPSHLFFQEHLRQSTNNFCVVKRKAASVRWNVCTPTASCFTLTTELSKKVLLLRFLRLLFFNNCLSCCKPRDWHSERRATHVRQACAMAELDAIRIA